MLGVVPHWARLLLWPAHLSADYAPSEILPAVTWGAGQTLGLLIALAWLGLVGATWRRRPVVALGLVWVAIGLFPVSNLLAPTGVVLAERTLFLPSAGLAIALAGGVDWLIERIPSVKRPLALAATIVGILGVARSASRSQVWRNEDILWGQTVLDAPKSQRAHHAFAQLRFRDGARAEADGHFRLAVEYAINDWRPAADYADRLRDAGLCGPAADYYQRALVFEPRHDGVRNKRILCLIKEGQFAEAATEARAAEQRSTRPEIAAVFRRLAVVADSGQAATER